jgi:adenylyl-sulfate kinase
MRVDSFVSSLATTPAREALVGHRGAVVWFTGLSGAGKTTIAAEVDKLLLASGRRSFLLDGDVMRTGISAGLGFSREDREENLRRFTEVGRLFAEAGVLALVAAISPYEAMRQSARERIGNGRFILVHMATPLTVCEQRDPKGLYRKARSGLIPNFTGLDAPYESPHAPDLRLKPQDGDPQTQAQRVVEVMEERGWFHP